jgi:hypothetical protein
MKPDQPSECVYEVYLDISEVSFVPGHDGQEAPRATYPNDGAAFAAAVAEMREETRTGGIARLALLSDVLADLEREWGERASANERMVDQTASLDPEGHVRCRCEGPASKPVRLPVSETRTRAYAAAASYRSAARKAHVRRRAARAVLGREALFGRRASVLISPEAPPDLKVEKERTKEAIQKLDAVRELKGKSTPTSVSHYADMIASRCLKDGKPIVRSGVIGWLKSEGLYGGRGDRDVAGVKERAEALADRVLNLQK